MNSVKTKKGTILPLVSLKGKDYLQVAYRLQWLTEEYERYSIDTQIVARTDESATVRSMIAIFDESGKVIRSATATKSETKRDFPDFLEKAETGSLGRALAMIGLGTQHAIADLEEGNRLADAPLETKKTISSTAPIAGASQSTHSTSATPRTSSALELNSAPKPVAQEASVVNSSSGNGIKKPAPFKRSSTPTSSKGVF